MGPAEILLSYYHRKRKDGKRFSMRAMSKKLGVSVSLLSLILKGKRNLPLHLVDPLCLMLDIDQVDRDKLVKLILAKGRGAPKRVAELLRVLDREHREESPGKKITWETLSNTDKEFITDWSDIAIFLSARLRDFDGTPEFVAKRLLLDLGLVNKKMIRLAEAGFLTQSAGKFAHAKKTLQIKSGKDFSLIRKYHKAHLENAIWALDKNTAEVDLMNRLITGMSLTVSRRTIPALKQKVQDFLLDIAETCNEEPAEEVFQLGVQFFPLSRIT